MIVLPELPSPILLPSKGMTFLAFLISYLFYFPFCSREKDDVPGQEVQKNLESQREEKETTIEENCV